MASNIMSQEILTARAAILGDLKRRYKEGDKSVIPNTPWPRRSENYFSGRGEMECPVCKTGTLRYARSGSNGHVHAQCTTDGCVSWME